MVTRQWDDTRYDTRFVPIRQWDDTRYDTRFCSNIKEFPLNQIWLPDNWLSDMVHQICYQIWITDIRHRFKYFVHIYKVRTLHECSLRETLLASNIVFCVHPHTQPNSIIGITRVFGARWLNVITVPRQEKKKLLVCADTLKRYLI